MKKAILGKKLGMTQIFDETGIMIVNDESDRIFDGLWSIKRVSGNSYYYNTQP